jgi:hypothetical membrane protein
MFEHEVPEKSKAPRDFIIAMLLLVSGLLVLLFGLACNNLGVELCGGVLMFLGSFFQGSRMIKYS